MPAAEPGMKSDGKGKGTALRTPGYVVAEATVAVVYYGVSGL